jgi:autotransporter-associated beta strand protein
MRFKLTFVMLMCGLVMPGLAQAAVKVWDGGGADANWMTKENWVGDVAPVSGVDILEFPESAAQKTNYNNYPFASYFFGINFSGATGGYQLSGNLLLLGGPVTSSNSSGTNSMSLAISLSVNGLARLNAAVAGGTLEVGQINLLSNLPLTGPGSITVNPNLNFSGNVTKQGTGTTTFTGTNTHTGTTTIQEGALVVNGSDAASPFVVTGGALRGSGTVGTLMATGGQISPGPSAGGPAALRASSTSLGASSALVVQLNGAAAGSGYDQLKVTGTVTLSGGGLSVALGFVPTAGAEFVVIDNDGTDPVVGTFGNLPEGATYIGPGLNYTLSYQGGTGNDVVLTAPSPFPNLRNRAFDNGLTDWTTPVLPNVETGWDSVDADQSPDSGSVRSQNSHASINFVVIRQCVAVVGGASYALGGRVLLPGGQPSTAYAGIGVTWLATGVCTQSLGTSVINTASQGSWQALRKERVVAPANAQAALFYASVGSQSTASFDNLFFNLSKPTDPVLVDLNGDGNGDGFTYDEGTGDWTREVTRADGTFSTTSGAWAPGLRMIPARFDADGLSDFFVFSPATGQWAKMRNDGSAFTIQASGQWWPGWERYALDLDGDGLTDFFLFDKATGIWFKCFSTLTGFSYEQGGWNPGWEIYPARLNDDYLADMFLIDRTTGRWFWVSGTAGTGFRYPVSDVWFPGWQIHPGDFNGDGFSDFLLHDPPSGTYFTAIAAPAGFSYRQGGWSLGWTPYVADFDADAKDDLFLHDPDTGLGFQMLGDGAGNFANAGGQTWSLGWELHLSDFDGDGRTDILLYDPISGTWYRALNLANGSFAYTSGSWPQGLKVITRGPVR